MSKVYDMKLITFKNNSDNLNSYIVIMRRSENSNEAKILVKKSFHGHWINVIEEIAPFDGDVEVLIDEQLKHISKKLVEVDGVRGSTMKIKRNFS